MHFAEFLDDEVATVRGIYERVGLEMSADAEHRMRRYLGENSADQHGRHRYTLAAAGLDLETERQRFADYQERYSVPSEKME